MPRNAWLWKDGQGGEWRMQWEKSCDHLRLPDVCCIVFRFIIPNEKAAFKRQMKEILHAAHAVYMHKSDLLIEVGSQGDVLSVPAVGTDQDAG